jgi:ADP-heptose:LPS heptosyltransferase
VWACVVYWDLLEPQLKIKRPINICVKRRAAIGDVVMTTGVVRELKKKYGTTAEITVATDYPGAYKNNPHITRVVPAGADISAFDVIYNLDDAYEYHTGSNFIDCYFHRVFGHTDFHKSVELFATDEDRTRVLNFQYQNDLDQYIVIHMRNWHRQAKNISTTVWFDIFARLFEQTTDFKIVVVGGRTDHTVDHPLFVDAREQFNDQQLKCLMDNAACFVGIDSGPFWCAAASDTHLIALLTHLAPDCIMPVRTAKSTAIPTLEDCAGCNEKQVTPVRQIVCSKGNTPCINNFDTEAIATAILETLK